MSAGQMRDLMLIPVDPQPTFIESSGRWRWPLPPQACFPGCSTAVFSASREWWEYAPSEAKPHPMAEAVELRDGVWYWAVPTETREALLRDALADASAESRRAAEYRAQRDELLELLSIITLNADIQPDARMNGSTDCYAVPLDDIEAARAMVAAITKSQEHA